MPAKTKGIPNTSLQIAWTRLRTIRSLIFDAQSQSQKQTGWNGHGTGTVTIEAPSDSILIFREKGEWLSRSGRHMGFTNVYRWTLTANYLQLEHLRFGVEQPVYLFELIRAGKQRLKSRESHLCGKDRYGARMEWDKQAVRLEWTIVGPGKNEQIAYVYR